MTRFLQKKRAQCLISTGPFVLGTRPDCPLEPRNRERGLGTQLRHQQIEGQEIGDLAGLDLMLHFCQMGVDCLQACHGEMACLPGGFFDDERVPNVQLSLHLGD